MYEFNSIDNNHDVKPMQYTLYASLRILEKTQINEKTNAYGKIQWTLWPLKQKQKRATANFASVG